MAKDRPGRQLVLGVVLGFLVAMALAAGVQLGSDPSATEPPPLPSQAAPAIEKPTAGPEERNRQFDGAVINLGERFRRDGGR